MRTFYTFTSLILFLAIACMNKPNHLTVCAQERAAAMWHTDAYKDLKRQFLRELYNWAIHKQLAYTSPYRYNNWRVKMIIFNQSQTKAILLVPKLDLKSNDGRVNVVIAEKIEDRWEIYYGGGLPVISYRGVYINERKDDKQGQPYTLEELKEWATERLVKDGLVTEDCQLNEEYINKKWFTDDIKLGHAHWLQKSMSTEEIQRINIDRASRGEKERPWPYTPEGEELPQSK